MRRRGPGYWEDAVAKVIAGDSITHSKGYRLTYLPMHPFSSGGYVYEHRLVLERKLGRLLRPGEEVHHVNGDRADNRPDNLELTRAGEHRRVHHLAVPEQEIRSLIEGGATYREIQALGVSTRTIRRVRRNWFAENRRTK